MRYSLPSRELIEDSIEIMAEAHQLDGLVLIPSCDKIVPGHIMAAGRLNLPTVVVTGGPMMPGFACDKELDLINVFEGWQAGGEALADLEEMGFFYQPHTSAGRLPTSKAYRLYVDSIMQRRRSARPSGRPCSKPGLHRRHTRP